MIAQNADTSRHSEPGGENRDDRTFCGGPLWLPGRLGNRDHLTCRDSGVACGPVRAEAEALERCPTGGRRGCVTLEENGHIGHRNH